MTKCLPGMRKWLSHKRRDDIITLLYSLYLEVQRINGNRFTWHGNGLPGYQIFRMETVGLHDVLFHRNHTVEEEDKKRHILFPQNRLPWEDNQNDDWKVRGDVLFFGTLHNICGALAQAGNCVSINVGNVRSGQCWMITGPQTLLCNKRTRMPMAFLSFSFCIS